ncbi:MAG: two-component regulator propeller domain-containing protein, partial [Bacteroidales bacterium]
MKKLILFFGLWFMITYLFPVSGIDTNLSFSHISVKDGLSQNTIFSIVQDSIGNMWFGTSDGVSKYDGYTFRTYRHNPEDSSSIAGNIITFIHRDTHNRLWFGTRNGLSLYCHETDRFKNIPLLSNNKNKEVSSLIEVNKNQLLVGTANSLLLYDLETEQVIENSLTGIMQNMYVITMLKTENGIFIGTMFGLYLYNPEQQTYRLFHEDFKNIRIQSLLLQQKRFLWVGSEGKGLYQIDLSTAQIKHLRHKEEDPNTLSSDYIRSLALDQHNQLWVGTFNDLNIYDENNNRFIKYKHDPFIPGSLSQNSIRSLYTDMQGGMWVGTYFGGINYYHPLKNRFRTIHRTMGAHSLNDNNISCMTEDRNGNLWIGTLDGGLNKWDNKTNHFTNYTTLSESLPHNIKTLHIDEKNNTLYIGAHAGGLSRLNLTTNQVTTYLPSNSSVSDENIYAILPMDEKRLWIGALNGLSIYDKSTQKFESLKQMVSSRKITFLLRDKEHNLWIGSDLGIQVYKIEGEELINQGPEIETVLSGIRINSIYESHTGEIWIGSSNGLYGVQNNRIRHYSTENGLPNNVIYGIMEDSFGRLWLSSNKGLTCLIPDAGTIKNYTDEDGIQSNQFNMYAFCNRRSGEMCFGSVAGITCFWPDLMRDNPYVPNPRIQELRLFNKVVRPGDDHQILSKSLEYTDHITLKASQSVFTLGFVVSNYIAGKHNYFSYKLDGFDTEWYSTDGHNYVSYSNLPAGDYTFRVKAANNDGHMCDQEALLSITVLPVWYKTWWALLFFLCLLIILVAFVIRYFWVQKSMQAKIQMERREKEKTEELNELKLRFFINISHELRTPLSLILDPLQEVIRSTSDRRIRSQLDYAQRNASRLLRLVNQLLDYRRAELGVLNLKVMQTDIHYILKETFSSYEKLARNKQITYTFGSDIEGRLFITDRNYVELMVNNLLSNAFKFTCPGALVHLQLNTCGDNLVISVRDTGIGIKQEQQDKIFERFYQIDSDKTGSGIGLSLVKRLVELHHGEITLESTPGEGTCFTISLPQREDAYTPEEWNTDTCEKIEDDFLQEEEDFSLLNEEAAASIADLSVDSVKKGSLLIVEDNEEIRRYLRDGLSEYFNVAEAENGREAITYLDSNNVDVILSDVMMPVMDGVKFCSMLKNNIRTCHLPVILLSAKADERFQLEAFKMGADDYIAKPFSMAMLTMKIQNQIRSRQRVFDHYSRTIEVEPEKISFNPLDEELLNKAKEIVERNIANIDFSTDDFSREMNMCRSNLHIKLKAITGESAIEFIRKVRFKKACELLDEGRFSVGEISTMVGFSSQSYFSAIFKKYLGC